MTQRRWLGALAILFAIEFVVLAIDPVSRADWLLENVLVFGAAVLLFTTRRSFPLSTLSYSLIVVFLALHEIGAHYTYAKVPYESAFRSAFGISIQESLNLERNSFDRFVHFSYGLLLAYPIREFYVRVVDVRGVWGYVLPLGFIMSTSMLFELFEWGAAVVFGGDLGMEYLGTQGDEWDAHKDMALALVGALVSMGVTAAVHSASRRDFAKELAESLRVKHQAPLGDDGAS